MLAELKQEHFLPLTLSSTAPWRLWCFEMLWVLVYSAEHTQVLLEEKPPPCGAVSLKTCRQLTAEPRCNLLSSVRMETINHIWERLLPVTQMLLDQNLTMWIHITFTFYICQNHSTHDSLIQFIIYFFCSKVLATWCTSQCYIFLFGFFVWLLD